MKGLGHQLSEVTSLKSEENTQWGRLGIFNMLVRRKIGSAVESLGLVQPGTAMHDTQEKDNTFALAPGDHGGKILSKPNTEICAVAPGTIITKPLDIYADAVIDGVTFKPPTPHGSLIIVRRTVPYPKVVIRNCTFEQPPSSTTAHVTVENGAKAVLVGCVFRGSGTTATPVVDHPVGAATDVQVAFCYNATGNTLGNGADVTMTGNI